MTVTVCCSPAEYGWLATTEKITNKETEQSAFESILQSQAPHPKTMATAYVHPLDRQSLSVMSQSSLEICTEGLGSETGSADVSDDDRRWFESSDDEAHGVVVKQKRGQQQRREDGKRLTSVNYHCSASRKSASPSFPPPLSSISRRDGSCIQMIRTRRNDGRLIMEAVPVAPKNYLHAKRQDGHLLLSFVDSATTQSEPTEGVQVQHKEEEKFVETPHIVTCQEEAEDEEDDEEEVEVVDRGTMVEVKVKVSSQPQQAGGAMKVLRSSLIINKFVGGMPTTNQNRWTEAGEGNNSHGNHLITSQSSPPRRPAATTTTAAAAAVAASSSSASSGQQPASPANKMLFTSKRRNRDEMLHHMRRCSELQRPLFFWEAGCVATSY